MLTRTRLGGTIVSGAALAVALATPAHAQTRPASAGQATTDAPASATSAQSAGTGQAGSAEAAQAGDAGDNGAGIADIVVTATKRETNLQRTPIAINVINDQAIRDRHVQSLYDLADGAVPSLRVATFEARQSALTVGIRGIVPLDANQPAREQGVGIYIDGIYLGRQHGLNAALFDVERIEVLKGPQGTLFGRNTEGGALSIVTKAPSGELGGRVIGSYGNYGAYTLEGHLDLPTIAGLKIKIDGIEQHQDATTKNPLPNQTGFNYFTRAGVRAAARWEPFEGFTDDFAYDTAKDKNSPFYSQLLNFNPNGCAATTAAQPVIVTNAAGSCVLPATNFTGGLTGTVKPPLPGVVIDGTSRQKVADIGVPQQPSVDRTHGFTNILKWKLSPEIELRSFTAWRGVDATQWDNSGGAHRVPVAAPSATSTPATVTPFSRYSLADLRQRQFSQELQAVGSVSTVDYVAGLYYFIEHVRDDAATPNSNGITGYTTAGQTTGFNYVILDPCTGSGGFGSIPGCRNIDRASEVRSRSYAAYGQLTWNATDALHLTVGGRYTTDKKEGQLVISRNLIYADTPFARSIYATPNPARPTLLPFAVNTAAAAANGYTPLNQTYHRFNPTATVAYDLSDTVHGYAKYATGYRAGGASSRTANYQGFGPEDVKSYELGLKTDLLDHRVRLNLAGYIMNRKGSQVDISTLQPTATGTFNNLVTINAPGRTKIRGIEADLTVQPVAGLTLNASYAYTYTRIPPVPVTYTPRNAAGVAIGAPTTYPQQFYIVFTPRNAASGSVDYAVPVGAGDVKLRFHIDGNYAQSTPAFDQFSTRNDSSFIVNGRVALADIPLDYGRRVTLAAFARNLFDEQYVYRRDPSNSLPSVQTGTNTVGTINNIIGDYGNFNAPRTYGAELSLSF